VWIDEQSVTDWNGQIGKNDIHGPYFKFGIYKPGPDGFRVDQSAYQFRVIEKSKHPKVAFQQK
jgi:hypothetical protein